MKYSDFKNKISLVTGGSGFIGYAVSEKLASLGSHLILLDINKKELSKAKKKIENKYDVEVDIYHVDMVENKKINTIIEKIQKKYKCIDVVINSVGMVGTDKMKGWNTKFDKQSIEAWNKSIEINLTSIFFLIQKIHKLLLKSKNASIVNISSIYGVNAPDWNIYKNTNINNPAGYSIAKAGVIYMTKWLASTLAPTIRVNCVSPGGVYRNQQKTFVTQYVKKTLLNRMASEDDIVGPVIFLASNMSSYITGENILIDGGWTIT